MRPLSAILLCSLSVIFLIGIMMVFDTTSAEILDRGVPLKMHSAMLKQLLFAALGALCAYGIYFLGIDFFFTHIHKIYYVLLFLLCLVFFPKIGVGLNGARRWIRFFGLTIQPSEFAKLLIPLCFIHEILQKEMNLQQFLKTVGILSLPLLLIFLEPDNGTTAIIGLTLIVVCFIARIKMRYWAAPMAIACVFATIAITQMPHVKQRLSIYLYPEKDLLGKGHQPYQAKIAAGSGGVFGKGLGKSLQKLNYLPEARSDYIAAIYAEEFGFLGISGLILCYLTAILSGFLISADMKEKKYFYVSLTFTFLFSLQVFLNLGVVSGILPSKGTNLPFFSQGGSSLIANMVLISLLIQMHQKQLNAYQYE